MQTKEEIELIWDTKTMDIVKFRDLCKYNIGKKIKHKMAGDYFIHEVSEIQTMENLVLTGNGNLQKEFEAAHKNPYNERTAECNPMVFANHILVKTGFLIKIRMEDKRGMCQIDSVEISVPKDSRSTFVIASHLENFITYE